MLRQERPEILQKETSEQFLWAVIDRECFMGTVRLVEFRPAINPQRRKWIAENCLREKGLRFFSPRRRGEISNMGMRRCSKQEVHSCFVERGKK
ncbi:hypothetical protein AVEN_252601-1 [Araneus ventricosus]|uniref:Uncharacterized protein n=1 Tax=Araneus ventricosus TaxID=182803 RepID=A0A4Y2AU30_ARAVE|nr:hypothetical protein AVEN_252601-1 [Araneus ventricosus]